jgi:transposase
VNPEQLVFLDETGVKTNLTRLRGWSDVGRRLVEAIPGGHWETCSLVQAIALDGTRAAMVLDGPMNSNSFVGFCEWLLAPSLHPGDLVVMDNLSSHKSQRAIRAIETVGARAVYLPPYSPDLNPIENIFSKLKQLIRAMRPRRIKEIVSAVRDALHQITFAEIEAVFEHTGYITNEIS